MFNKLIYTLLILAFSGTLLTAQTQQTKNRRRKDRNTRTQQTSKNNRNNEKDSENSKDTLSKNEKPDEQTGNAAASIKRNDPQQKLRNLMKVDPRLPGPNAGEAKQIVDQIKKDFADREFPRKMKDYKSGSGTALLLRVIANSYKKSLAHPDLEEATGIRLSWYNEVGAAFVALYKSLDEVERGVMLEQEKRYITAAVKYMELAKILGKILDKPEKIPPKELEKIKEKNIERRKQEIKKKINELMRQRRTGR